MCEICYNAGGVKNSGIIELMHPKPAQATVSAAPLTGDKLRHLAYVKCGLNPAWMEKRWSRLADAINDELAATKPTAPCPLVEKRNPSLPEFLDWIGDRLEHHYGESPNLDFVQACHAWTDELEAWESQKENTK